MGQIRTARTRTAAMRSPSFQMWLTVLRAIKHVTARNPRVVIGRMRIPCTGTTTMASSLLRIHASHRMLLPTCLSYSCRRRAMMSAWSSRSSPQPQPVTDPKPKPPLRDPPPIVIPNSKTPLSPDAASPQTAARPPRAPKTTRPKPTIRAQKAAIALVSKRRFDPQLHFQPDL